MKMLCHLKLRLPDLKAHGPMCVLRQKRLDKAEMYIRKIQGPHRVTLPDGSSMTRSDLPSPRTTRWVASRKAAVVKAVNHGLMSAEEAIRTYSLSEEELASWRLALSQYGERL